MEKAIVLMGVSGCGKTALGKILSQKVNASFIEGDEYHPSSNINKMSNGIPLDDNDRLPWLMILRDLISEHIAQDKPLIMSCSALKEKYRQILRGENNNIVFIYLRGSYDMIYTRMQKRTGHYMKPGMLQSQFDALEEPLDAITVDIDRDIDSIVQDVIEKLGIGG